MRYVANLRLPKFPPHLAQERQSALRRLTVEDRVIAEMLVEERCLIILNRIY